MSKHYLVFSVCICGVLISSGPGFRASAWAAIPTVTSMPVTSASTLIADDTTPYNVTLTVTDGDGHNNFRDIRTLFDYTESGGDHAAGRGYLAWGASDADIARYGGTWVTADATGGGRWGYNSADWGGTTYLTPTGCTVVNSGQASGGSGSKTVTFEFTVKSAWAFAPLVNDADLWFADYSTNVGWMDAPTSFDVVAAPCGSYAPMPRAPVVSNPSPNSLSVAIHPSDSSNHLFAIRIQPAVGGREYVQANGGLGVAPRWQTKTVWGTRAVTGLLWGTSYTFDARSYAPVAGQCPSDWGPATTMMTSAYVPVVDFTQGTTFSTWVRGQCPYRSISATTYPALWNLTTGSSGRGLAGGLDADTYDWRDINSGANWGLVGGHFTTLEFLQYARDRDAAPMLTANVFGGGYQDSGDGTFICQYDNPEGLAADWVRYTNFVLQNYRLGDEGSLSGEDLRVYNSIADWGGRAMLLSPAEGAVPAVQYWEIGNEPEVGGIGTFLSSHYVSPTDYHDHYKSISQAMLAVDPTLKIGPCLINPADAAGSGQWLSALAADAEVPMDFVAYHPYYSNIKNAWGNPDGMRDALRSMKAFLLGKTAPIRTTLAQYGRTADLMATEWNPVNWDAASQVQRCVAQGLGVAESCFTFAEDGVLGANFWEQPQNKLAANDVFAGLRDYMGDTLVANVQTFGLVPDQLDWRLYVTKDSAHPGRLVFWGLNFSEDETINVTLGLPPCRVTSATLRRYGKPGDDASGGDTSLMHSSGMSWTQEDVSAGFDFRQFVLPMDDAEVTLLILEVARVAPVDFDVDGDVDQSDFGQFQQCLLGGAVPQSDPACVYADTDQDGDVDQNDFPAFAACFSGPEVPADPDCAN